MIEAQCPICHGGHLFPLVDLKALPIHQNFLYRNYRDAINADRGNLHILFCPNCGFAFNKDFNPNKISYTRDYENSQICSPYFLQHISNRINRIIDGTKAGEKKIVEIGCGNGYFLRELAIASPASICIGYDPAFHGGSSELSGRLKFIPHYFKEFEYGDRPDIVICRHVIEHIRDPILFLQTIREAINDEKEMALFVETPDLNWILENKVFWDFFYEHCSYFSLSSLMLALKKSRFKVIEHESIFKEQYLWIKAEREDYQNNAFGNQIGISSDLIESAKRFSREFAGLISFWQEKIKLIHKNGPVAIWGAGAKGAAFVNLVDPEGKFVHSVVDINPVKQGGYIAGTGHPIINYQDLAKHGIHTVVLMNLNYEQENRELLKRAGIVISIEGYQ